MKLAITLMTDQELYRLAQIEELTGLDIEHSVVEGFEPVKFKPELLTRESREMRAEKLHETVPGDMLFRSLKLTIKTEENVILQAKVK